MNRRLVKGVCNSASRPKVSSPRCPQEGKLSRKWMDVQEGRGTDTSAVSGSGRCQRGLVESGEATSDKRRAEVSPLNINTAEPCVYEANVKCVTVYDTWTPRQRGLIPRAVRHGHSARHRERTFMVNFPVEVLEVGN